MTFDRGARWSDDLKDYAGTELCQLPHVALVRAGELSMFDLVRRYGVIVDWGTGELFRTTTEQFREMLRSRTAQHWT